MVVRDNWLCIRIHRAFAIGSNLNADGIWKLFDTEIRETTDNGDACASVWPATGDVGE